MFLVGAAICGVFIAAFAVTDTRAPREGDAQAFEPDLSSNTFSPTGGSVYGQGRTLPATELHTGTGKPRAVIACFHEKSRGFSAEAHPRRCHLRGYREQSVVGISIKNLKWGHWGANHTRAAYGVDLRDGSAVRVIVFRPITCEDGLNWYSRVVIFFPADSHGFEFDLPTCDGLSVTS
jgi:hypothetical protein